MGKIRQRRRFCGRCGAETQADDKFCQSCGHELGEGGPQTQAPDGPSPRHASGNETPDEGVASAVRAFLRHPDAGKKNGPLFWVIIAFGLAATIVLGGYCIGGVSQSPDPVERTPETTVQLLWLGHYPWALKTQIDAWTTNCENIQEHFDLIYESRDGYKRRFGRYVGLLTYLYEAGKKMGCKAFP